MYGLDMKERKIDIVIVLGVNMLTSCRFTSSFPFEFPFLVMTPTVDTKNPA